MDSSLEWPDAESDIRGERAPLYFNAYPGTVRRCGSAAHRDVARAAEHPHPRAQHAPSASDSGSRKFLARALPPGQIRTATQVSETRMEVRKFGARRVWPRISFCGLFSLIHDKNPLS